MSEEKKTGRKLTQARKEANARYNSKFVEVKVRMTPERRSVVQDHAASMGESATKNPAVTDCVKQPFTAESFFHIFPYIFLSTHEFSLQQDSQILS